MPEDSRSTILAATVTCLGRHGIAKTTVDDAARAAGVARATVYRHFPDGKEQLIAEAIEWAVADFFTDLAVAIDDTPDFASLLEAALTYARPAVDQHEVLQKVLLTEPERLLPHLTQAAPQVQAALRLYLEQRLAQERLLPGVTVEAAADWLARMMMSCILSPGSWDLDDPAQVRRLVRDEFLVGILAP